MALQKTITSDQFGAQIDFANAYICLQNINLQQQKIHLKNEEGKFLFNVETSLPVTEIQWMLEAAIMVFASRDAKFAGKSPVLVERLAMRFYPAVPENLHTQLYTELKKLPQYADAVDV